MLPNPPAVRIILKTWSLIAAQVPAALHAEYLASLFARALKPALPFDSFLEVRYLYLQQIPADTAREAWGIHYATTKDLPAPPTHSNAPALTLLSIQTKPTT